MWPQAMASEAREICVSCYRSDRHQKRDGGETKARLGGERYAGPVGEGSEGSLMVRPSEIAPHWPAHHTVVHADGTMSGRGGRPRISWHRGGAELAPAGSLAAFSSAASNGAELVEVDLRSTADNVLVCVHDNSLPGFGRVGDIVWAQEEKSLRSSALLFTFEEVLDALDAADPAKRTRLHLDLKETAHELEAVAAVLERGRPLTVTTTNISSISAVRRAFPSVPGLLTIGKASEGLSHNGALALRARELLPFREVEASGASGVAAHYLLATPVLRRWCRWRGLELLVWTIDEDARLRWWLCRSDVDVVTTNRPLAALAVRDRENLNR
jgi:glycerophosphoryl diester phosphodiesterase